MELWIKNQNGTRLIKANNILLYKFDTGEYGIQVNDDCFVGEYDTKERALEVLDEIQSMIHYTYNFENLTYEKADLILKGKIIENMVKIYEMPKE